MDELIRQLNGLLKQPIITLDADVKVWQIVVFVAILAVSLIVSVYIRRWFRRIFDRLKIQQNNANRLLAILFLIIMVVGVVVAFNVAQISTGLFGKVINYPLSDLFQSSGKQTDADSGETDSGEKPLPETVDEAQSGLTLAKLFYGFVIVFGMFVLSKYAQLGLQRQVLQAFQIQRHTQFIILRFFSLHSYHYRCAYQSQYPWNEFHQLSDNLRWIEYWYRFRITEYRRKSDCGVCTNF
jgi:ABC-type uncharacterized transport system fused permease/ATPase subunit